MKLLAILVVAILWLGPTFFFAVRVLGAATTKGLDAVGRETIVDAERLTARKRRNLIFAACYFVVLGGALLWAIDVFGSDLGIPTKKLLIFITVAVICAAEVGIGVWLELRWIWKKVPPPKGGINSRGYNDELNRYSDGLGSLYLKKWWFFSLLVLGLTIATGLTIFIATFAMR